MVRRWSYRLAVAFAMLVLAAAIWGVFSRRPASTSGPMKQGVYVWQRNWSPQLRAALKQSAGKFDTLYVLAAEVTPKTAQIATPDVDYAFLATLKRPVCLVIRVGVYSGPFDADAKLSRQLLDVVRNALKKARGAGLQPCEIQIDFDCAESKLAGYAKWMTMLAKAKLNVRTSFTALPSWLDRGDFKRLAATVDGFVLQIHSFKPLRKASAGDDCAILCSRSQADRWIWQAARAGKPFRIALPTYSYLAAFDKTGKCVGISAEGPLPNWPADATVKRMDSPADRLVALMAAWGKNRPANMAGVIWFRLPVSLDSLNFSQPALDEIMRASTPAARLEIQVKPAAKKKPSSDGSVLYDILLKNAGTLGGEFPQKIVLTWAGGRCLASDGLNGYTITHSSAGRLELQNDAQASGERLLPGDSAAIGWLRLPPHTEVKHEIIGRTQK